MESNEDESVVKQVMLQQAKKSLLLLDHSKFDKTAFVKTCDLQDIDTLVTNKQPDAQWQKLLVQKLVTLIC